MYKRPTLPWVVFASGDIDASKKTRHYALLASHTTRRERQESMKTFVDGLRGLQNRHQQQWARRAHIWQRNANALPTQVYCIVSGYVAVTYGSIGTDPRKQLITELLRPGDLLGVELLDPHITAADRVGYGAYAMTSVTTDAIPLSAVRQQQGAQRWALRETNRRLRERERRLWSAPHDVKRRLAELLLSLNTWPRPRIGPDPQPIPLAITHLEMAQWIGATRETVTVALGELKRDGIITFDGRCVVILNPTALRYI